MTKKFNPCVKCHRTAQIYFSPSTPVGESLGFSGVVECGCRFGKPDENLVDIVFGECEYAEWNKANPFPADAPLKKCCGEEPVYGTYRWLCQGVKKELFFSIRFSCGSCSNKTEYARYDIARAEWQALEHKAEPEDNTNEALKDIQEMIDDADTSDTIKTPPHYQDICGIADLECLDAVKAILNAAESIKNEKPEIIALAAQALQYRLRAGRKGDGDIEKALQCEKMIKQLRSEDEA